jgi:hypothetical protein
VFRSSAVAAPAVFRRLVDANEAVARTIDRKKRID